MNPTYSISKPCSEDWNKMTTEEQGRHCQVCCKTVVDFSKKSNSEIIGFLKTNSETKVCGRFRTEQLAPRHSVNTSKPVMRYRTFFAALVFVFGGMLFSSCANNFKGGGELMGDVAYSPDTLKPQIHTVDTTTKQNIGPDTTKKTGINKINTPKPIIIEEPEPHIMGDIAFEPDTLK